jgi:hypothetical protein
MDILPLPIVISAVFFLLFLIQSPVELWEALTFKLDDGKTGTFVSVGCWVFFGGFVTTIIRIYSLLNT